jgi:hypothetical protein
MQATPLRRNLAGSHRTVEETQPAYPHPPDRSHRAEDEVAAFSGSLAAPENNSSVIGSRLDKWSCRSEQAQYRGLPNNRC